MGVFARLSALFRAKLRPVVVHDSPAPRDLDETFFDEKAQERAGRAISKSTASAAKPRRTIARKE
jgi:hypothetical protein